MFKKFSFLFILITVLTTNVFAATVTWDNGAADSYWDSANNWDPDGVPTSSDFTWINSGSVTLDSNESIYEGYMGDGGSATLTMSSGSLTSTWALVVGIANGSTGTVNTRYNQKLWMAL